MRAPLTAVFAAFILGACGRIGLEDATPVGGLEKLTPFAHSYDMLAAADVATLMVTDKTMVDHIVSYFKEEDCSAVRASQGEPYCRPIRVAFIPAPEPFCYRSLASVSCFATPNPYGTDHRMGTFLPGMTRVR